MNQIATTVADNAGRVTTGIDEANIYEVFAGANAIGTSMDFEANGRVVLSSLQDNGRTGSNHGQMINWQRCWGDLDAGAIDGQAGSRADGGHVGAPDERNIISGNTFNGVVLVESGTDGTTVTMRRRIRGARSSS